jgi:hypothetical protein
MTTATKTTSSFDGTTPAFHVRKLSTVSQNIFKGSFDVATMGEKTTTTLEYVVASLDTPKTSRDMQIQRRIACCHFLELTFFMFAFLFLVWLHEVSTTSAILLFCRLLLIKITITLYFQL